MSSEEDRMKSNQSAESNTEDFDMSSLLAGIRRVPTSDHSKSGTNHAQAKTGRVNNGRTTHPTNSAQNRKKKAAHRKRVERMLMLTIVLVIAVIGLGIFFLVQNLGGKKNESTVTSTSMSAEMTSSETTEHTSSTTTTETTTPAPTPTPSPTPFPAGGPDLTGYCVVIDPGHQEVANTEQESMSSSMGGSKDRSALGYSGVVSGINESEINLEVGCLLKAYLESLGCEVYMTRETNDVDISNQERAEFAVAKDPDLFIRLYCNAANDSKTNGCEVIVPSSGKYASEVITWGENLGRSMVNFTNGNFNGCKSSGQYSGLNWAESIPSFMIRMGYLTNSDDEANLLDEAYRMKVCQGIAQFIATMPKH